MPTTRFTYRHQYDDARDAEERTKTDIDTGDDTLTQQQYTKEVNLNVMMQRMGISDGSIPPAALDPRYYGDFTKAVDLQDIFNQVREATDLFNALPADVKNRFNNDPAQLLDFSLNDANREEAVKLGLLPNTTVPTAVEPVTDTTK